MTKEQSQVLGAAYVTWLLGYLSIEEAINWCGDIFLSMILPTAIRHRAKSSGIAVGKQSSKQLYDAVVDI